MVLVFGLILAIAVGVLWYFVGKFFWHHTFFVNLQGHNSAVRSYAERFIPERFLPEFSGTSVSSDYTPVSLVGEDDIEDDGKQHYQVVTDKSSPRSQLI